MSVIARPCPEAPACHADAGAPTTAPPRVAINPGAQVTMVLRHRVAADAVPAYEQWLARFEGCAQAAPGHLGMHVVRPVPGSGGGDYMLVPRFENADDLARWSATERHQALLTGVQALLQCAKAGAVPAPSPWPGLSRLLGRFRTA